MKKKKFKLVLGIFLIIIGIVTFSYQDVKASVSVGEEPTSGLGYSIEHFVIHMFNQEGMSKTQAREGDASGYVKVKDVTSEISVAPSAAKVHDLTDHVVKNDYKLISVKLNINGGISKIKELMNEKAKEIKSEGITGGDNDKYVVVLTVQYKLTLPQNGSWQVWDIDYGNVFSEAQKTEDVTETNTAVGLNQMVVTGIFDSNSETIDWNQGATYNFDGKVFTSRFLEMPLLDEYSLFQSNHGTRGKETYRFMMHDMDNLEDSAFFKEDLPTPTSSDDKTVETKPVTTEDNSRKGTQTVSVPNTAANERSRALFGSSILLLGSAIVLFELRKKTN